MNRSVVAANQTGQQFYPHSGVSRWRNGVKYCLVRVGVSIQDYDRDSRHRRHCHISNDEKEVLLRRGFVEWLSERRGVLRFVEGSYKFRLSLRGSSSRYGKELAAAIWRREGWALVVQQEMRRGEGRRS